MKDFSNDKYVMFWTMFRLKDTVTTLSVIPTAYWVVGEDAPAIGAKINIKDRMTVIAL